MKPDYEGGSIVNLMSTIIRSCGGKASYPLFRDLKIRGKIVLLLIDGMGYEYLKKNSRFFKDHMRSMTSVFPSTTSAAITSVLTGLAPMQHCSTGWYMNVKELAATISPLPFMPRSGGASYDQLGIHAGEILGKSLFHTIKGGYSIVLPAKLKGSPYNEISPAKQLGYSTLLGMMRQIQKEIRKDRFVYAYWPSFDGLAHERGMKSRDLKEHLMQLELAVAKLAEKLDATLIVTADHGLIDVPKKNRLILEDYPELQACLSQSLSGEARAPYCYVHPHKEKEFRKLVRRLPCRARKSIDMLDYFGKGKPDQRFLHRIGDYFLEMDSGYVLMDNIVGESDPGFRAFHGGTSREEMMVPLIVF